MYQGDNGGYGRISSRLYLSVGPLALTLFVSLFLLFIPLFCLAPDSSSPLSSHSSLPPRPCESISTGFFRIFFQLRSDGGAALFSSSFF